MLIGLIPRRAANGTAAATFTAIVWGVSWPVEADKNDDDGCDDDDDGDDDDDDDDDGTETAADEVGNEDDEEEEEEVKDEAEVEEKSVNEPRFGVEGSISVPPPLPSPVSPPMLLVTLLLVALLTLPRLNKSRRNVFPKSPASNPCSKKKGQVEEKNSHSVNYDVRSQRDGVEL